MTSLTIRALSVATLSTILLWSTSSFPQEAASKEVTIVDAACKERKMAACVAEATFNIGSLLAAGCPAGSTQVDTAPNPGGFGNFRVCKFTDISKVPTHPKLAEGLQRCKDLVENFPSYYGESCLRPLGFERMINAFGTDLPKIFAQMCEASGGTNCAALNKVPGVE